MLNVNFERQCCMSMLHINLSRHVQYHCSMPVSNVTVKSQYRFWEQMHGHRLARTPASICNMPIRRPDVVRARQKLSLYWTMHEPLQLLRLSLINIKWPLLATAPNSDHMRCSVQSKSIKSQVPLSNVTVERQCPMSKLNINIECKSCMIAHV